MTVLDTSEKPTRPPPRKFKLTPKPPVTSSQLKPTATAANVTTTTSTVKAKQKSLDRKAKKKNKKKPWKKNKVLTEAHMKKNTLRQKSKEKSKMTTVVKSVSDKVKQNQTATADLTSKAPQTPNDLKDDTWKIPQKKDAQRQTRHAKKKKKKSSAKEYHEQT